ncbi:hypothetical protein [Mycobacterium nebraskense]|uniref:hypothetical protein n=1 Tax=Mycobacterium nebraskense TaxID=244292 RepID=UPI000617BC83|nr:hypothetical protein [Mycobacterium nebraskense]KKC04010.1 hypothetical protein WU83_15920 [Mycobacterium nebraskense]
MSVTAFQDLPLADRDRKWEGDAAEKRVPKWAGAIMDGARGGVDLPKTDVDRVKSHLAKYYEKMGEGPPWERG